MSAKGTWQVGGHIAMTRTGAGKVAAIPLWAHALDMAKGREMSMEGPKEGG